MDKITFKPWVYACIPILVWFLLLVLPFLNPPANFPEVVRHRFIIHIVITNTLLLFVFYIHTYLLYPLLQKKGWVVYLLLLVALLVSYWAYWRFFIGAQPNLHPNFGPSLNPVLRQPGTFNPNQQQGFGPPPMGRGPGNFVPALSIAIAMLCSYCYRIILDNNARQQLLKERDTIHLRTELSFLRSQINPHFLFNVLNNLTSLARKRSELIEPAIINLSQLMRYMLYESDDNKVLLSKEIAYLKSYIELQHLKFGDEVLVKMNIVGNHAEYQIAPMLLISLIENAFKHGAETMEKTTIFINLTIIADKPGLYFSVINDINSNQSTLAENSGIGLKNLKRRLDILYPAKHRLQITNTGQLFTAELSIDLD